MNHQCSEVWLLLESPTQQQDADFLNALDAAGEKGEQFCVRSKVVSSNKKPANNTDIDVLFHLVGQITQMNNQ